jgi:glycosyltransferase involved in cell wall biosynthesis
MLGARMHYAVPRLLNEAGLLERFFTDSYVGNKPWLEWLLRQSPARLRPTWAKRWLGRQGGRLPADKVVSFDAFGVWYAVARRGARTRRQVEQIASRAAAGFTRHVIAQGLDGTETLWGYNTAALELFRRARSSGVRCILEQTMLPMRLEHALLSEEERRWPGWSRRPVADASSILADREEAEWALADRIVVGSAFVGDGLRSLGVPDEKIVVVPYGVDPEQFPVQALRPADGDARLRVLFIGQAGLRKGIPDLLAAVAQMPARSVALRIAGPIDIGEERVAGASTNAAFLGSVPRADVAQLLAWSDVLVLPSIVEGSATVTYEALMSGRPVVTTHNAGSIVRDGTDGRIVPIRDPRALADALLQYADDRALLARHSAAVVAGRERAGIARYGSDIVAAIRGVSC